MTSIVRWHDSPARGVPTGSVNAHYSTGCPSDPAESAGSVSCLPRARGGTNAVWLDERLRGVSWGQKSLKTQSTSFYDRESSKRWSRFAVCCPCSVISTQSGRQHSNSASLSANNGQSVINGLARGASSYIYESGRLRTAATAEATLVSTAAEIVPPSSGTTMNNYSFRCVVITIDDWWKWQA